MIFAENIKKFQYFTFLFIFFPYKYEYHIKGYMTFLYINFKIEFIIKGFLVKNGGIWFFKALIRLKNEIISGYRASK